MKNLNQVPIYENIEMTYYVVDDLRAWMKHNDSKIEYFDTLEKAIEKFKQVPEQYTTALGIEVMIPELKYPASVDLVQRNNMRPFISMDVLNKKWEERILDYHEVITAIRRELAIDCKSEYRLFNLNNENGRLKMNNTVLIPFDEGHNDISYIKNKRLNAHDEINPVSAIGEVFVHGNGWMPYEEFLQYNHNQEMNSNEIEPKFLYITKLHVDYIDDKNRIGSADMDVAEFRYMAEKFLDKEKNKETSLDSMINKANKTKERNQKEMVYDGGERDDR